MITRIDHLGIAVTSLEKSIELYERLLGVKCQGIEEVPSQKVRTAFFAVGEVHIELLEPTAEESAVAKFLKDKGEGVHHIAYHTDDVAASLEAAKADGFRLVDQAPRPGAGGKMIAFLHPKTTGGVLTELCQGGDDH